MRLGEMAHRMESAVEQMDGEHAKGAPLERLMVRFDAISACFEALRALPLAALVLPEAIAPEVASLAVLPDDVPEALAALADERTVSVSLCLLYTSRCV